MQRTAMPSRASCSAAERARAPAAASAARPAVGKRGSTTYRGSNDGARQRYTEALALAERRDLWWPAALAHGNLGMLAVIEGRHADAFESHERCSRIAREGGDAWMAAMSLTNAGRAVRQLGDVDRAIALQGEALRGFLALENAWGVAVCLDSFAGLAADRGDPLRSARLDVSFASAGDDPPNLLCMHGWAGSLPRVTSSGVESPP